MYFKHKQNETENYLQVYAASQSKLQAARCFLLILIDFTLTTLIH